MNERHHKILELITKNKSIEVVELSKLLNVSQVTIRKDLIILEQAGLIVRKHGYARLNDSDDMNIRLAYQYDIKKKIAKLASTMVEDGETIMIESGSCCALLALEIAMTKKDVTLITNSAFICDYVRKNTHMNLILLGGEYQKESQVMVGPMTRQCVEAFHVDKLFIGIDGFSVESGFTGNDYMRSVTVQDMARQAKHTIVVSNSTKFNQVGLVHLLNTNQVSDVVTDDGIDQESKDYLTQENIQLHITKK